MNAKELWETTMDPATRMLLQVTLDDAATADELFSVLMGEDVESRRSFITRNARTSASSTSSGSTGNVAGRHPLTSSGAPMRVRRKEDPSRWIGPVA